MKKIIALVVLTVLSLGAYAQEFSKNLASARTAYSSGNLSDSRFAMEQMLRDLDMAIGKEIIKLLPAKMDALAANVKDDNVTGGGAGVATGLFVQRTYGASPKTATIDIINNSPLITSLNALLAIPFLAKAASDQNQKVIKVQGYKAILNKVENSDSGKVGYELQVPLQNTLFTFRADDTKEADILKMAETIPLAKIAQMAN